MSKLLEQYVPVVAEAGLITNKNATFGGNVTITGTLSSGAEAVTSQVITSASANAFAVGLTGATNPIFNVDNSTASAVAGLTIKGAATGGTVAVSLTDTGAATNLSIDAKGSGTISFGGTSTGNIIMSRTLQASVSILAWNASATSLWSTANGTNPTFAVDNSTSSAVAGLTVKGAVAGGTVALSTTDTGSNNNLSIAALGTGTVTINPAVVAAAGGKASSGIQWGSLSVGLYTGTGAPTFSAMNGSIYVDSEATTTTTRIYVNKSGAHTAGTTWTNLTTAA